jgi:hypothetical protein
MSSNWDNELGVNKAKQNKTKRKVTAGGKHLDTQMRRKSLQEEDFLMINWHQGYRQQWDWQFLHNTDYKNSDNKDLIK